MADENVNETAVELEEEDIYDLSSEFELDCGLRVEFTGLNAIQILKLMKILVDGGNIDEVIDTMATEDATEEVMAQLMILGLISAAPNAQGATLEFIRSCLQPAGLVTPARDKVDRARNEKLWSDFRDALENPSIEDTVNTVGRIIVYAAENMEALGKSVRKMTRTVSAVFRRRKQDTKIGS